MSLFQICYGPEIGAIYQSVQKYPGIPKEELIMNYQYQPEGDISSLIDAVLNFLMNLKYIEIDEEKNIWPKIKNTQFDELSIIKSLRNIADNYKNINDQNYVFSTMYYQLFVVPNRMYIKDLYYETNLRYEKFGISHEKINAWKRIMEYLGLGYRVYSGFYALPHISLIKKIIRDIGEWDGPLQLFFEVEINSTIPCVSKGNVFTGVLYALLHLGKTGTVTLSKKQDLPYLSYGEKGQWNWINIGGVKDDSLYHK